MQKSGQRTLRQAAQWKQQYARHRRLYREIRKNAPDILGSPNFKRTGTYIQHGNMSVKGHSMNVARYSLAISDKLAKLGIACSRGELIRGALLHDYFLYDWHDRKRARLKPHGFYHPSVALENAAKEYVLTQREQDIIRKHMWPLTVIPPVCREAWIVTTADKWCSLLETIGIHQGRRYG